MGSELACPVEIRAGGPLWVKFMISKYVKFTKGGEKSSG